MAGVYSVPMLAFFVGLAMLLKSPPSNVPLVAHRGESHDAPENTLASFALAWERGDDTVETDIHVTADGELIISHDFDTQRTTGQKLIIRDTKLADLRKLSAGAWWHDPKWADQKLPTLQEVLNQMPAGKRIFVEIKTGPEAVPPLKKLLDNLHRPPQDIVIISFHLDSVREAKKALPDHVVHYLVSQKQDRKTRAWTPTTAEMIAQAKDAGANGLDVAAKECVDAAMVKQVHDAGLKLLAWTVDDPKLASRLAQIGVDGVTTNRAAWLKQQLQSDATK
jgi:glycerophosphoryl diester phosphodiesterase